MLKPWFPFNDNDHNIKLHLHSAFHTYHADLSSLQQIILEKIFGQTKGGKLRHSNSTKQSGVIKIQIKSKKGRKEFREAACCIFM